MIYTRTNSLVLYGCKILEFYSNVKLVRLRFSDHIPSWEFSILREGRGCFFDVLSDLAD